MFEQGGFEIGVVTLQIVGKVFSWFPRLCPFKLEVAFVVFGSTFCAMLIQGPNGDWHTKECFQVVGQMVPAHGMDRKGALGSFKMTASWAT